MKQEFKKLKEGQSGILLFTRGFLGILFRPVVDIFELIKKEIYENLILRNWTEIGMAIIPILLILWFIIYGFSGIYKDIHKKVFSSRYEEVIIQNYEKEIYNFFRKYEERFLAQDCGFMAEVAADERMYERYGNESYPVETYDCSAFGKVQRIKMLPLKINPIEKAGNKFKVQGELIRVEITNGKPYILAPIRFELWKTIDMDLWHFNLYGETENRWIESELKLDYK